MSDEIDVRPATARDLAFVAQDGTIPPEIVRRKIDEGEVFVATVAGEPAGYLRLEHLWSLVPYIGLIYVLEPYRRQGVGKGLLAFVAGALQRQKQTVLYSSAQADEPAPQAWHRRMGFAECGLIAGINEGDVGEIFFRKRLDAAAPLAAADPGEDQV